MKIRQRPIRVLMSYSRPGSNANPFTLHLATGLAASVDVRFLTAGAMLWGRFDVLHVHWPENLFRGRGRARTLVKSALGLVLLLRLRLGRKPVVYTKHNLVPHEDPGRIYGALYRYVQRTAIVDIYLNESTENNPVKGVTILHGDYPRTTRAQARMSESGSGVVVLAYGQIRRYKGLDGLLEAFQEIPDRRVRLRVRGVVIDSEYDRELQQRAQLDDRVEYIPGFVPESELERELELADIVVLPYARIYNSGAAILALSHNRPVLVPDGKSTRSLRAEMGKDYVHLFAAPLTSDALDRSLSRLEGTPRRDLVLVRRDWEVICGLHERLYGLTVGTSARDRRAARKAVRRAVAADPEFVRHSPRNTLVVAGDGE